MPKVSERFDPQTVGWRHVLDASDPDYLIYYDYCLLGYDLESGHLDMMPRFKGTTVARCARSPMAS